MTNYWRDKTVSNWKHVLRQIKEACDIEECKDCPFILKDGFCGLSYEAKSPIDWADEVLEG